MTAQESYNQAIRLDFSKKFHEGIYVTQIGLVPMCFPAGSEGLSLITAAANQGYAPAQYQLALYYLFEHEHRKAATKHIEDNHTRFAACQTLERNEQGKGMQLLESAAHQNHGDACLLLGDIYSENTYCGGRPFGTVQNNQKAFEYYNKGAHSACADAMYRLGRCYYYGEGTAESNATAFIWFCRAQEAGCTLVYAFLGDCYMNAYGTTEDIPKAISYLSRDLSDSHSGFHDSSAIKLACIYRGERGFQYANPAKAKELLTSIASNSDMYDAAQQMLTDMPAAEQEFRAWQQRTQPHASPHSPASKSSSGGCYVATAVYGSYDCPEVWTLRRFRDDTLGASWYGRGFIRLYYTVSPILVNWFGDTRWFKSTWKTILDKLVVSLNQNGVKDTPYHDHPW